MPRTSPNNRRLRKGEAGFTVLEAALALAVTLGVALAAVEILRSTSRTTEEAQGQAIALSAAESALARIGADLPLEPGLWETESGAVRVRVEITPFAGRARALGENDVFNTSARESLDPDDENRRKLRGRPLLATVTAEAEGQGRAARARLSRIVIAPADEAEEAR